MYQDFVVQVKEMYDKQDTDFKLPQSKTKQESIRHTDRMN